MSYFESSTSHFNISDCRFDNVIYNWVSGYEVKSLDWVLHFRNTTRRVHLLQTAGDNNVLVSREFQRFR